MLTLLRLAYLFSAVFSVTAFAPPPSVRSTLSSLQMISQAPPPVPAASIDTTTVSPTMTSSTLQQGIDNYMSRSSSIQVALQERKIPTKEEIEEKKRNFNIIFWGRCLVGWFACFVEVMITRCDAGSLFSDVFCSSWLCRSVSVE